jgi:hypothetical protein
LAPKLQCVLFASIDSLRLTCYVKSAFFVLICSCKFLVGSEDLFVCFRDDLVGTSSRFFFFIGLLACLDLESGNEGFLLLLMSDMLLSVEIGVLLLLTPEPEDRDDEKHESNEGEDEAHDLPEYVVTSIGAASCNVDG